jgi:TrmH family RNA methyltransferase
MKHSIRIVLVGTTHPGNIGAAARAMKTMQLSELYLVAPRSFPDAEATSRASGADDLLARAVVCDSLDEALQGCGYIAGTSARLRSLEWPMTRPRECAKKLVAEASNARVALVFGQEKAGLSNQELDRCNVLVNIPCNPEYSSLNLAMAVQLMAYEIMLARGEFADLPERDDVPASADEMANFYAHLEQVLLEKGFLDPHNPRHLMRRLRRLFNRSELDQNEVNILRGILAAVQNPKRRASETGQRKEQ